MLLTYVCGLTLKQRLCLKAIKLNLFNDFHIKNYHHIKVSKSTDSSPEHGSSFHSLDPHGIGKQHTEDSNTFIIIGASY